MKERLSVEDQSSKQSNVRSELAKSLIEEQKKEIEVNVTMHNVHAVVIYTYIFMHIHIYCTYTHMYMHSYIVSF